MKIAKETWVILAIGLADLITTIIFIKHHGAVEANPLFRRYWEMGMLTFVAAKIALLVGPLCVLEWARKRNPAFVSWALRTAIAGYIVMYGIGIVKLNDPARNESEAMINIAQAEASIPAIFDSRMKIYLHRKFLHHTGYYVRKDDLQKVQTSLLPKSRLSNLPPLPLGKLPPRAGAERGIVSDTEFAPTY